MTTRQDDQPLTMSVPDWGNRLGLGRNASYAAAARGDFPTMRFGKLLRVPIRRAMAQLEPDKQGTAA